MKRPILIVALGYIVGIIIGLYCKNSMAIFFLAIILIPFIVKYITKRNYKISKYYNLLFDKKMVIIFIIAYLISNFRTSYLNKVYEEIYKQETKENFVAVVISTPIQKEYYTTYKIKIQESSKPIQKNSIMFLNIKNDVNLEYGEKISFKGEYKAPEQQRNYKGFSYRNYLKSIGIYGTINVDKIEKVGKENVNVVLELANNFRKYIIDTVNNNIKDEDKKNLLLGILIGYDDEISSDVKEQFSDSSLSHILAVSGMHVAYILLFITVILNKMQVSKKINSTISISILIFFMFLTQETASVQRACIMAVFSLIASLLFRKNDIINSISISLLIILIKNPFEVMNTGLILSYVATIGIVIGNNILKPKEKTKTENNLLKKFIYKIRNIIYTSIYVQIFILPIMILRFNKISLIFFVSNIIISFIIGTTIVLGFIYVFIPCKFIYLILEILLQIILNTSKLISNLQISKILVTTPNMICVISYYIILAMFLYKEFLKRKEYKRRIEKQVLTIVEKFKYSFFLNLKWIIPVVLIILILFQMIRLDNKELKIYFIDVGQGDASLIVTPSKKSILIDGGGSSKMEKFDVGKRTLLPYLLDRKIKTIDYLMISHFDSDHVRRFTYNIRGIKG